MVKPLQPELISPLDGPGGPVPEANLPGHHPEHDQDKPSGRDFVAKMHALAQQEAEDAEDAAPPIEDEVLDLTQLEADHVHTGGPHSPRAELLAHLAGKPFELVGAALGAVRSRLPG